jgi:hypothetical protein
MTRENPKRTGLRERCFWTAVAERSGDTAFGKACGVQINKGCGYPESGVALRFPPQSKSVWSRRDFVGFFPRLKYANK